MIRDSTTLAQVRASWETVRLTQAQVKTNLMAGATGVVPQAMAFWDLAHSLVLLFAFSVLEEVLQQLRDEGAFHEPSWHLARLMNASKAKLPWVDFATIDQGRGCRNTVAHERQFIPRAQCWTYIDAIEKELIAWGILAGPVTAGYTISVGPMR